MLVGYVVMPDHVHLLISEPPKSTPSVMLKALKQRVSRDLRRKKRKAASGQLRLPFLNDGLGLPRFWQPRFYDFNVYSGYKVREKLEYMHANPVKRGLVKNPGAWMWSSFLSCEKGQVRAWRQHQSPAGGPVDDFRVSTLTATSDWEDTIF